MSIRILHRWMMLVFGVLISYWIFTGVWLALLDLTDSQQYWVGDGGGPGAPVPEVIGDINVAAAGSIGHSDILPMVTTGLNAARAIVPDAAVSSIELSAANRQQQVTVHFIGETVQPVVVDIATGRIIDENADVIAALPGLSQSLHRKVKNLHRGNIGIGGPVVMWVGTWFSVIVGGVLVLLSVTGMYLYLRMWAARRRAGRRSLFWKSPSLFHQFHRWISVIAVVFILNQAITGTLLGWFNLTDPAAQSAQPASPGFSDTEVLEGFQDVWQRASAAAPQAPVIMMMLRRAGPQPLARVYYGGENAGAIAFRLAIGDYIFGLSGAEGPGGAAWDSHTFMKRLHRGDAIGYYSGRYMSLFAGLSMAWLLISGLVMYLRQRRNTAKE